MADKQIEVELITKANLGEAEDLGELIEKIKESAGEEITLQMTTDELQSELESTLEEVNQLQEQLMNMELGDPEFDDVQSQLEEATSKAEMLSDSLDAINGMVVSPDIDTSGLDEMQGKIEETSSTADSLTTAIAGIGATAGFDEMATRADRVNTSWNQLDLTFRDTGVSMDTLREKSSYLTEATGRSGSQVRDYFNQMGIAGITNVDLLTTSFENMAGRAYQTGTSIESIEGAVQRMVLTGNAGANILRRMGLNTTDLAEAMGVSADEAQKAFKALDESERLEVINKLLGDGTEANEMYKNSYAGLKEQADIAMGGLMVAIGQSILPVVIPALQAATQFVKMLSDGFKALPGPVQTAIGGLGGIIAISTAAIGILGVIGKTIKNVHDGLDTLRDITSLDNLRTKLGNLKDSLASAAARAKEAATTIATTLKEALTSAATAAKDLALKIASTAKELLISAANAVRSAVAWVAQKAAMIASTLATYAMEAAQWALNVAMDANPIGIIVLALAALVAGLIWAYQNVDWFREMVDNAWATLQQFAEQILGVVQPAVQFLADLFNQFTSQLGLDSSNWLQALLAFIMFIPQLPAQLTIHLLNAIAQVLGFGSNFTQNMISAATRAVTGFISYVAQLPGRVGSYLSSTLSRVTSWAGSLASQFLSAASRSVSNFANQISQIPAKLGTELSNALNKVNEWAATLPQKFWDAGVNAVKNFLSALGIASPGTMQRMLVWEVSEMARRVPIEGKEIVSNIGTLGRDITSNFNPSLETANATISSSGGDGSIGYGGQVNNFYFSDVVVDNDERMQRIAEYIRKELAFNNMTAGRTV